MLYNLDYSIEKPPTFKRLYNHDYCTKNFPRHFSFENPREQGHERSSRQDRNL